MRQESLLFDLPCAITDSSVPTTSISNGHRHTQVDNLSARSVTTHKGIRDSCFVQESETFVKPAAHMAPNVAPCSELSRVPPLAVYLDGLLAGNNDFQALFVYRNCRCIYASTGSHELEEHTHGQVHTPVEIRSLVSFRWISMPKRVI